MTQQANNFLSLDQIVKMAMSERGEKALTNYERYLQSAIECYAQMAIFEMNTISTARLDLDVNTMTAPLPPDFVTMIKIGIEIRGKLHTLTVNNNLLKPDPTTICDNLPVTETNVTNNANNLGYYFGPYYWNGYLYQARYGQGGGINCAYYRIDYNNNTIIFDGFTGDYPIILEYKSSGVSASGGIVPREASEALKAGIHYYTIRNNAKYSPSERQEAERRYNIELYSLSRMNLSFNYDEIMDVLYSTYKQSPKR